MKTKNCYKCPMKAFCSQFDKSPKNVLPLSFLLFGAPTLLFVSLLALSNILIAAGGILAYYLIVGFLDRKIFRKNA